MHIKNNKIIYYLCDILRNKFPWFTSIIIHSVPNLRTFVYSIKIYLLIPEILENKEEPHFNRK